MEINIFGSDNTVFLGVLIKRRRLLNTLLLCAHPPKPMLLFILNSDELQCRSHTSANCRLVLEEDGENQYEMSGRRSGHRPPQLAGAGAGWLWNKGRYALKKVSLLAQSGKGIYFFLIRLTGRCLAVQSWAGLGCVVDRFDDEA